MPGSAESPSGFPSALGASSPSARPVSSKSLVPMKRIEEGIRESLAEMLQAHLGICPGTPRHQAPGDALAPKANEVQAPVSALHPSHPPKRIPIEAQGGPWKQTGSSWVCGQRAPHTSWPVRTLDSGPGLPGAAGGKRGQSRAPLCAARQRDALDTGSQALGD